MIFLKNCSLKRMLKNKHAILWESFLDPSDSYFLFADLVGFYTLWTYMRGYHKWALASKNLTGPKTIPTIWHTYMKLVTKYQISAINSCWEKCNEKYLGWTEMWFNFFLNGNFNVSIDLQQSKNSFYEWLKCLPQKMNRIFLIYNLIWN
jgi:hypothetical protein